MEWRKNEGYLIVNHITIGKTEIVMGVHEKQANMFVTWECKNKNDYYFGHYFTNLYSAQRDFCERGAEKAKFYEEISKKRKNRDAEVER